LGPRPLPLLLLLLLALPPALLDALLVPQNELAPNEASSG
jgi:hypothetical protein